MSMRPKQLWRALAFASILISAATRVEAAGLRTLPLRAAAQCPRTDRTISKSIRFTRNRATDVRKDVVRLCTSHEYRLDAQAGEKMSIKLATGRRTSFTLRTPSGDIVEGADGVKNWSGAAPETGAYAINIGTDATARYTLTVTLMRSQ